MTTPDRSELLEKVAELLRDLERHTLTDNFPTEPQHRARIVTYADRILAIFAEREAELRAALEKIAKRGCTKEHGTARCVSGDIAKEALKPMTDPKPLYLEDAEGLFRGWIPTDCSVAEVRAKGIQLIAEIERLRGEISEFEADFDLQQRGFAEEIELKERAETRAERLDAALKELIEACCDPNSRLFGRVAAAIAAAEKARETK